MKFLEEKSPSMVLIPSNAGAAQKLSGNHQWLLAYSDEYASFFLHRKEAKIFSLDLAGIEATPDGRDMVFP
jgi:hypothetical protein